MKTSPRISFGLYALEIKSASVLSSASDLQSFSKLADLKTGNIQPYPLATYEYNFWLLDGNYKLKPVSDTNIHVGMMSLEMSDSLGVFADPPILTIDFDSPQTTDGIVLRFSQYSDDYASSIILAYFDASDNLIVRNVYTISAWEAAININVANFQKITITFSGTNKPYRYLRLTGIDYGQLIYIDSEAIKTANLVEEIDLLSVKLPICSFEVNLFSESADFNIMNPAGYYDRLTKRQPLSVYEIVSGAALFIGPYYLDTWKNTSDKEVQLNCVNLVGVLEKLPYKGGLWASGDIVSQDLIADLMEAAAIPYDLDINLYDIPVVGWLPVCSIREALQQIVFSIGGYVDCSRGTQLRIYKTLIADDETASATITRAEKGARQAVELRSLVTGVEVTAHNYYPGAESVSLFDGTLAAGDYEIQFKQPAHSLSVGGATITESGVNYAILHVTSPGAVTLDGLSIVDTVQLFSQTTPDLSTFVTENIIKITGATLVNSANGEDVTQLVYDYYQQRYSQSVRLYASSIKTGDIILVDTLYNTQIKGVVEKISIDLAGGFIQDADIIGVVNVE